MCLSLRSQYVVTTPHRVLFTVVLQQVYIVRPGHPSRDLELHEELFVRIYLVSTEASREGEGGDRERDGYGQQNRGRRESEKKEERHIMRFVLCLFPNPIQSRHAE